MSKNIFVSPYLIVLLVFGAMYNPCFSENTVLTILHTNDTYGRLLPFSKDGTEFGGVLRRAYIIRQIWLTAVTGMI